MTQPTPTDSEEHDEFADLRLRFNRARARGGLKVSYGTITRLLAAADRAKEMEALLGEAVGALDLYHAYGWPDRMRVCDRIRAAIA